MGFVYMVWLLWLFVGIAIVSDIFMESIEVITAQTTVKEKYDREKQEYVEEEVKVWNETIANLTLMALGSSAPEILLNVLQAAATITESPPELGPSTIVGSAAFNLLCISGVSIIAVGDEPKKIQQVGVFAITSIASIFAYIWMLIVLRGTSQDEVEIWEAILTFVFFILLIIFAYVADRIGTSLDEAKQTEEEKEEREKEEQRKAIKTKLRKFADEYGNNAVILAGQGVKNAETAKISDQDQKKIVEHYQKYFDTDNLKEIEVPKFLKALQADSLLERFAYRNRDNAENARKFSRINSTKGQLSHETKVNEEEANKQYGFKCLHYSVTESAGHVELTVIRKNKLAADLIGVRTVDGTAKQDKDYNSIMETIQFQQHEDTHLVKVPVIDDQDWNPDLDFYVELFDTETGERLPGVDTRCQVTILDEDFPGVIGFADTEIRVGKTAKEVTVKIDRFDGSAGEITCLVSTEELGVASNSKAIGYENFLPYERTIEFGSGEKEASVTIQLLPDGPHM